MEELLSTQIRRKPLIERLLDGASEKAEIVEEVDASRTTIDRAFRELEEADVITRDGRGYRLTFYGRLAHDEFDEIMTRYESLSAAKELLAQLPPDTALDLQMVKDAEVICADECGPVAPYRQLEEMVERAAEVRAVSPIVLPSYVDLFVRVVEQEADVTLIFDSGVLDVLANNYPEEWDIVDDVDNCTVRETCEVPPYALVLADEAVWLGVYSDGGNLIGALINGTLVAVDWAGEVLSKVCAEVEGEY